MKKCRGPAFGGSPSLVSTSCKLGAWLGPQTVLVVYYEYAYLYLYIYIDIYIRPKCEYHYHPKYPKSRKPESLNQASACVVTWIRGLTPSELNALVSA